MRATLNIEVTDAEIKQYGQELLLKGLGAVMQTVGDMVDDPNALMMFQQAFGTVQQGIHIGMRQRQQQQREPGPVPGGLGPVPTAYGHPSYPYPTGAVPPVAHTYYPPGPYGAHGPGPGPYYGPPGGPPGPNNVRPIQPEPAQVEHCFHIEANQQQEEGVVCCHCATVNGVYRKTCRRCGHEFCGAIVTPAPRGPTPPQVHAPQSPLPTGGYAGEPAPPQGPIGSP